MCKKSFSTSTAIETVAKEYARRNIPRTPMLRMAVEIAFQAGAEWQTQQASGEQVNNKQETRLQNQKDEGELKTLNELKEEVFHTACLHGWHDEQYGDAHLLCLAISELMEALQADREGRLAQLDTFEAHLGTISSLIDSTDKQQSQAWEMAFEDCIKDTVQDEWADVVIRLLDLAALRRLDLDIPQNRITWIEQPFTNHCFHLCRYVTADSCSLSDKILYVIRYLFTWADHQKVNLYRHVILKMKYNTLRPYKHGGKKY